MGVKPDGFLLDRIDNDGNYEPDNCRWATPQVSGNNSSRCRFVMLNGQTKSLSDWSRTLKIPYGRIQSRLRLGWSEIDALTKEKHG